MARRKLGWMDRWIEDFGDDRGSKRLAEVLSRARFLDDGEQRLLNLALLGGRTYREIGMLVGMNAGCVCRRTNDLVRRLADPLVARLLDDPRGLSPVYLAVGRAYFVNRQSARCIAREQAVAEREVLAIVDQLRRWAALPPQQRSTSGRDEHEAGTYHKVA